MTSCRTLCRGRDEERDADEDDARYFGPTLFAVITSCEFPIPVIGTLTNAENFRRNMQLCLQLAPP